jgi:hypothetical protein
MRGAIPPLPKYVFMAWYLVKHRDNTVLILHYPRKFAGSLTGAALLLAGI